jgi:hypothetical protein
MGDFKIVDKKPDLSSPAGFYEVIVNGIFWGRYVVATNWAGDKYVAACDPQGCPY